MPIFGSKNQMAKSGKTALRILVVDDEAAVCRAIKMLLAHEGHTVEMADSGETGLAKFAPGQFDLVITDFLMTGMDGSQFAAEIKARQPGLPVILATASVYGRNPGDLPSVHVDCLLNKPFTLAELREAIIRATH